MPPAAILSSVSVTMSQQVFARLALPQPQQQLQVHAVREFGGGAEAAVAGVEGALERAGGVVEELRELGSR